MTTEARETEILDDFLDQKAGNQSHDVICSQFLKNCNSPNSLQVPTNVNTAEQSQMFDFVGSRNNSAYRGSEMFRASASESDSALGNVKGLRPDTPPRNKPDPSKYLRKNNSQNYDPVRSSSKKQKRIIPKARIDCWNKTQHKGVKVVSAVLDPKDSFTKKSSNVSKDSNSKNSAETATSSKKRKANQKPKLQKKQSRGSIRSQKESSFYSNSSSIVDIDPF